MMVRLVISEEESASSFPLKTWLLWATLDYVQGLALE